MEHWDLNREVEGCDNTDSTKGPSVASVELSSVIAGLARTVGEEADTISTEIFKEINGDVQLGSSLDLRLGNSALDALHEEVHDFLVVHDVDDLAVNLAEHQVSLLVLEGIVKTGLGHVLH